MRIALLGGSFDPPHIAHQLACLYLLEAEGFERVWLLPCYQHAFGKTLTPFEMRFEMCALAVRIFNGRVVVSEVERSLAGEDGNRTIDTVEHLQANHPDEEFTLVIGSDILLELDSWKQADRLKRQIAFLVLSRGGHEEVQADLPRSRLTLPEVSSTQIRKQIHAGHLPTGLIPRSVATYIQNNALYQKENGAG